MASVKPLSRPVGQMTEATLQFDWENKGRWRGMPGTGDLEEEGIGY